MNFPTEIDTSLSRIATDAAIQAGKAVMEIYNRDFVAEQKSDGSVITEADVKSNEILVKMLSPTGITILSEEIEDSEERLNEDRVWIIDPLDGTRDFIGKTGDFTVMISLIENGKSVLGVIYVPVHNDVYVATKGKGTWRYSNEQWTRLYITRTKSLPESIAVASRNHLSDAEKAFLRYLNITQIERRGSSLKAIDICEGKADMYITLTNKIKHWDTAASYCLITEAGGVMTDMNGNDVIYNTKDVCHTHGVLITTTSEMIRTIATKYREWNAQISDGSTSDSSSTNL